MKIIRCIQLFLFLVIFAAGSGSLIAQTRTVGKIYYDDSLATLAYTLFTPNQSFKTYLVENCGLRVHEWNSAFQPGMMAYLRPDGTLLRSGRDWSNGSFASNGGNGGYFEILDWWSQQLWLYKVSDSRHLAHHDFAALPNGNVMVLAWEKFDFSEAKLAGRDTTTMPDGEIWSEALYELQPIFPDSAKIVWEWHIWDHLVQDFNPARNNYGSVGDHPELMDINYLGISQGDADWLHANTVSYNPDRDEVAVTFRETSEFIVIDHSTNTATAAGHSGGIRGKGGDILYRWGNPEAYRRGNPGSQQLFQPHDAHWVDDTLPHGGEFMIFNNGFTRPGGLSTVDFVSPELDSLGNYVLGSGAFSPDTAQSIFRTLPGDTIDSGLMGGAQMLANGNLFITQAVHGRFIEFDSNATKAWEYINPAMALSTFVSQGNPVPGNSTSWNNAVFKARKYMPTYPGLAGRPLPHGLPLENMPWPDSTCITPVGAVPTFETMANSLFEVYPNPAQDLVHIRGSVPQKVEWLLFDSWGRVVKTGFFRGIETEIQVGDLPAGMYILRLGKAFARKLIVE
ncbi:MAG: aryl-sulfate sulfotransferase [Bacteroidetes bacterium]|nr:aryl-sulfate sulfotransferase [Bacteroidota bacterium]